VSTKLNFISCSADTQDVSKLSVGFGFCITEGKHKVTVQIYIYIYMHTRARTHIHSFSGLSHDISKVSS
jgi:hypothetical protein